jgi:hypothetical protein
VLAVALVFALFAYRRVADAPPSAERG